MTEMGVSVIMPCYKAGRYLVEAVDSVLAQPFQRPYEVIVVDDGSPDAKTQSSLRNIENLQSVKVLRLEKNAGQQVARNAGIKASSFNYISMMDADDCLNRDPAVTKNGVYAERAVEMLHANPNIAFVHTLSLMFDGFHGLTISSYPVSETLILEKHHAPMSLVYRKSDAFDAGLHDEAIKKWTDWSFAVGLLNARMKSGKANEIGFLGQPYYLYRVHQSTQRISNIEISEREMVRRTVFRHPEIFRKKYAPLDDEQIVDKVTESKPSKLIDLLHVAAYDLNAAKRMVAQRGFKVTTNDPRDRLIP